MTGRLQSSSLMRNEGAFLSSEDFVSRFCPLFFSLVKIVLVWGGWGGVLSFFFFCVFWGGFFSRWLGFSFWRGCFFLGGGGAVRWFLVYRREAYRTPFWRFRYPLLNEAENRFDRSNPERRIEGDLFSLS